MDVIPPDPYRALGVPRDATSAAIKTTYRKAALKCHPDKVEGKGEEFYKIQQAYEILGDDTRRQQYDDLIRLQELRRDVLGGRKGSGSMPNTEIRTASYDIRSPNPMGAAFNARGPTRMGEERRHSATKTPYDDIASEDYFASKTNSKKYEGRPSARPSRSSENGPDYKQEKIAREKERERLERAERDKQRTREQTQDRGRKYYFDVDSDESSNSDNNRRREAPPRRRHDENERPRYERPRAEQRSSDEDTYYENLEKQKSDVRDYINRSKVEGVSSPFMSRASPPPSSYHPRPQEQYDSRKSATTERPGLIRRSSTTRHKEKPVVVEAPPPRLSRRDSVNRRSPEADLPNRTGSLRRPPPLTTTQSSPGNIKIPSPVDDPRRSRTDYPERPTPQPRMQRAETMPSKPVSSSRTVPRSSNAVPTVGSNLRQSETHDSGYSTSSPSETPPQQAQWSSTAPPTSFKPTPKYYGDSPAMVDEPVEYASNTRPATILREPSFRDRTSAAKAPPPSRSASYHVAPPPAAAERATSRDRAKTATSSSVRRPALQRTDSTRQSSRAIPGLNRGSSMPLPPMGTPNVTSTPFFYPSNGANGTTPQYFDDANVRSASPQEMYHSRTMPTRKNSTREDGGYGRESTWDEEPVLPRMASVKRSNTSDSNYLGRSGTVREARDPRERENIRESGKERDRDRERMRESGHRGERERVNTSASTWVRESAPERPRAPTRRSATHVF